MAELVLAIHVLRAADAVKTWMPGMKPGMTSHYDPRCSMNSLNTAEDGHRRAWG